MNFSYDKKTNEIISMSSKLSDMGCPKGPVQAVIDFVAGMFNLGIRRKEEGSIVNIDLFLQDPRTGKPL